MKEWSRMREKRAKREIEKGANKCNELGAKRKLD
jgi:hypothetical protein